jgi:hypothetical protein
MKSLLRAVPLRKIVSFLSVASFAGIAGCGGDSSSKGGSSSAGVVSCDIYQLGMHYCEEAPGSPGTNTGCPTMMTGFTPGAGCSRTGVVGTCKQSSYEFFLYTAGVATSTLASICPGGTFELSSLDGGLEVGAGGATSSSVAGACVKLQSCCNSSSNASLKASCLQVYTSALASGDKGCSAYLPLYKLALNCQ